MPSYDAELLEAARLLLHREGQGRLPSARIRRSVSTSYYALFHFLLEEVGQRIVGTHNVERVITAWQGATDAADKDFKNAVCVLILLKGQLRSDP